MSDKPLTQEEVDAKRIEAIKAKLPVKDALHGYTHQEYMDLVRPNRARGKRKPKGDN